MLEKHVNIPDYFMSDISDTDERARYEKYALAHHTPQCRLALYTSAT